MVGTHGASEYDGHTARYTTHTYSETKMQMWIVKVKEQVLRGRVRGKKENPEWKQALRTRSCVLRIFSYSLVAVRKPLGSC